MKDILRKIADNMQRNFYDVF